MRFWRDCVEHASGMWSELREQLGDAAKKMVTAAALAAIFGVSTVLILPDTARAGPPNVPPLAGITQCLEKGFPMFSGVCEIESAPKKPREDYCSRWASCVADLESFWCINFYYWTYIPGTKITGQQLVELLDLAHYNDCMLGLVGN